MGEKSSSRKKGGARGRRRGGEGGREGGMNQSIGEGLEEPFLRELRTGDSVDMESDWLSCLVS